VAGTSAAGAAGGEGRAGQVLDPPAQAAPTTAPARRTTADYWRHDPRLDPPTKKDRRRLLAWIAFMAITPLCLAGVVWSALNLNGNYPTVPAPVPAGWQSVPGIYASFSAPKSWSLQQFMSDSAGDIYYSGPGGGVGESVTQAARAPQPTVVPTIVATFLVERYRQVSRAPYRLRHATDAWKYEFRLANGSTGVAILAWVAATQSQVWLVATPGSPTTEKVLSTLTVAT